jgi:restriction system protein
MSFWVVRAGQNGEQEKVALDKNVVTIDWWEFTDLSNVNEINELKSMYRKVFPHADNYKAGSQIGQIWNFLHNMQIGDLVALPLHVEPSIALGLIVSNYEYKELPNNVRHIRYVKWLDKLPKSAFDKDLLNFFCLPPTVYKINETGVVERVLKLLQERLTH